MHNIVIATYQLCPEKDVDAIQVEGVVAFCQDLGVDPSDVVTVRSCSVKFYDHIFL